MSFVPRRVTCFRSTAIAQISSILRTAITPPAFRSSPSLRNISWCACRLFVVPNDQFMISVCRVVHCVVLIQPLPLGCNVICIHGRCHSFENKYVADCVPCYASCRPCRLSSMPAWNLLRKSLKQPRVQAGRIQSEAHVRDFMALGCPWYADGVHINSEGMTLLCNHLRGLAEVCL